MAYSLERETHIWLPEGEPRAVVQIIHGMAEHIGRYERFAKDLNRRGYAVAGLNLRGHGENAEIKGWFAEKDGWTCLLDDARKLTETLRKRFPGKKLVLMGHSMGSFLAREYVIRFRGGVDALVLSGTGHYGLPLCGAGWLLAKLSPAKKPAEFVNGIAFVGNNKPFEPGRTPFDWLTRNEQAVDEYVASPLCGFTFTGSAFADFFGGLVALTGMGRVREVPKALPVLFVSGDADPVGQMGKGVRITEQEYRKAGLTDLTVKLYKDGRHELISELNRDEVIGDLADWLDTKCM